jgi:hypothetical protein
MRIKTIIYQWVLLLVLCSTSLQAQTVYENHRSEIYNYLGRMAQKGLIQFDDHIRPLSRVYIGACLDSLQQNKNQLSPIEKSELNFYLQEFSDQYDTDPSKATEKLNWFKKDANGRFRMATAIGKDASIYFDPTITGAQVGGTNKNYTTRSTGLRLWGRAGKRFAFQFAYQDIFLKGNGYDTTGVLGAETGYVRKDTTAFKTLNYSQFRGSISYSFKNGSIAIGQDHLLWGYGENGRTVLSDKAPAFPFIRLDYQLFPWLKFHYTHAWLNSRMIDSTNSYPSENGGIYGGDRILFVPKYFATHSIQIKAMKGLDISLGESIVYSDRMDAGYLIPVMFFKLYDNLSNNSDIRAGSNGQLFIMASSRNQIKNTHLYGTFFIDEIRQSTIFNRNKSRNQIGFNIGASVTDLFIPYLTAGFEYTRVNPFVYRNLYQAQNYTHQGFVMGDWMGNNFDRMIFTARYTPIPKLKLQMRYQVIRKGGSGTLADQYFAEPQPRFLFNQGPTQKEFFFRASYEWLNNLTFTGWYSSWNTTGKTWSLGVGYGL